jgi:hypothetical protein
MSGAVDIPTTLLVTNDFPPKVGGIQRTLEALVRQLPVEKIGVFCPSSDDAAAYDLEAAFRVFRQPEDFLADRRRGEGRRPLWRTSVPRSCCSARPIRSRSWASPGGGGAPRRTASSTGSIAPGTRADGV